MKILNDLSNFLDTVRWTVLWKLEDAKNAVLNLLPRKQEDEDPFVGNSYIEEAPVKKKTKKTSKKKKITVKRSKG
jgi:hypothetical protein